MKYAITPTMKHPINSIGFGEVQGISELDGVNLLFRTFEPKVDSLGIVSRIYDEGGP